MTAEESKPRRPRLLLVEHAPSECMFLFEMLQADYEIEVAADGRHAWTVAQLRLPDLVLADIMMPGMDGFELARRLRTYPTTAKVPIILMSGSGKHDLVVEAMQAGANDVLLKPLQVKELMEALRSRLAGQPAI